MEETAWILQQGAYGQAQLVPDARDLAFTWVKLRPG